MRMEIDHLVSLNGRLYYRRRVPEHLRPFFKQREVKKSLKLKEHEKLRAVPLVAALDRQFEERKRAAEKALKGLVDPHDIAAEAWEWALEEKFVGYDRSGLGAGEPYEYTPYEHYIDTVVADAERRTRKHVVDTEDFSPLDRAKIETVKRNAKLKPEVTLKAAKEAYIEFKKKGKLGKAEEMGFKQFEEWLKVSKEYPQYNAEGFIYLKDVTRAGAAKYLQYLSQSRGQGDDTVRRRLSPVRSVWNFAILHFELDGLSNPWSNAGAHLETSKGSAKKTKVLAFTKVHLEAIEKGLKLNSVDPELRLLLATLRCTGARPLEIGGLLASDVHSDGDGGAWINIDYNEVRPIKNSASVRRVPIIDRNTAMGLLELAGRKRQGALFQRGFHTTSNLSQRCNRFLRVKCGLPKSNRIVNYSFRHSMIEAFREAGIPMDLGKAIVGHSEGSVTEGYGAGAIPLQRMREALEAAMSVLGEVDTYNYRPEELILTDQVKGETA